MNIAEYREYVKNQPKASKWNAVKKEYNGRIYHSTKEADYSAELDLEKKAKNIIKIEYQVPYQITVNGQKICKYILDFKVTYKDKSIKHIDVKGAKEGLPYQIFKLKKKLMKACHGIDVIEI